MSELELAADPPALKAVRLAARYAYWSDLIGVWEPQSAMDYPIHNGACSRAEVVFTFELVEAAVVFQRDRVDGLGADHATAAEPLPDPGEITTKATYYRQRALWRSRISSAVRYQEILAGIPSEAPGFNSSCLTSLRTEYQATWASDYGRQQAGLQAVYDAGPPWNLPT